MADFTALKTAIQNAIKQNGNEEITGNILQDVLLAIVSTLGDSSINDLISGLNSESSARQLADSTLQGQINTVSSAITAINYAIASGCVYAGIATPSTTPVTGKVFYLALTAGTYTNFGNIAVTQGINILKYNGSAWSLDAFVGIDDTPTPSSQKLVKSGGVFDEVMKNGSAFDLSAYNGGATYADLNAALTALNALPAAYKRGGMSMKFVLSSDNKYVQCRFMLSGSFTAAQFTNVANWQGVDDEPTAGSENLVKSGGVYAAHKYYSRFVFVGDNDNADQRDLVGFIKGRKYSIELSNYSWDATGVTYNKFIVRYKNTNGEYVALKNILGQDLVFSYDATIVPSSLTFVIPDDIDALGTLRILVRQAIGKKICLTIINVNENRIPSVKCIGAGVDADNIYTIFGFVSNGNYKIILSNNQWDTTGITYAKLVIKYKNANGELITLYSVGASDNVPKEIQIDIPQDINNDGELTITFRAAVGEEVTFTIIDNCIEKKITPQIEKIDVQIDGFNNGKRRFVKDTTYTKNVGVVNPQTGEVDTSITHSYYTVISIDGTFDCIYFFASSYQLYGYAFYDSIGNVIKSATTTVLGDTFTSVPNGAVTFKLCWRQSDDAKQKISLFKDVQNKTIDKGVLNVLTTASGDISSTKPFVFALVTDTHLNNYDGDTTHLDNFIALANNMMTDMSIHCGDIISSRNLTATQYRKVLLDYLRKIGRIDNYLGVVGNHEYNYYLSSGELNHNQLYTYLLGNKDSIVTDEQDPTGCYYYKDFAKDKVRVIVLNSVYEALIDEGTGFTKDNYGERQLAWLDETLKSVPSGGWRVVIFAHHYDYDHNSDINDLINAYVNRSVVGRYNHTNSHGSFVAYFHGHRHVDMSSTTEGFLVIGCNWGANSTSDNKFGTCFYYSILGNTIKEYRIGYGEPRNWSF